jgi:hypothetical protein
LHHVLSLFRLVLSIEVSALTNGKFGRWHYHRGRRGQHIVVLLADLEVERRLTESETAGAVAGCCIKRFANGSLA